MQFTSPTSAPAIDAGQSLNVTVNEPVTWSLQVVGRFTGTLSNQTSTDATYTAPDPSEVTGTLQVTIVATLVSDKTQSAALGVVIQPVLATTGALSGNTGCQYDPINFIGLSNGSVGSSYPSPSNGPPSAVGGTGPYTWSVKSGALPVGLSLGSAATTSSASVAYLYGTPVSAGCSQITLQVTDATGASATSTTNYVIITPPALKIQIPNYADAYSATPYPPTGFTVTGGVPPYRNWGISAIGGSLPPGMTLSSDSENPATAVISGAPQACGVGACQTYNPIVQVEDSQSPYPAYGSATLNVNQWPALAANACMPNTNGASGVTTNNANLQGSYAFLLRGFDADGPVVMAGSFVADGAGEVTAGVEDVMRTSGSQTNATITGGSFAIVQQGTVSTFFEQAGCLVLTTSTGTTTFAVSMGGCSTSADATSGACVNNAQGDAGLYTTGRVIESDDDTGAGTRASGIIRLQDNSAFSAGLTGTFAFGLSGRDSIGGRYAAAGSFRASSGALSSVAADINDGGVVQSSLSGGTGSLGVVDATTGRQTASISIGSSTFSSLALYVVSAREVIVAETGVPGLTNPVVGGEAISTNGSFSNASLQNSHIFHIAGLTASGADPSIGILQFDGVGGFTGTQYEDQTGTIGVTSLSGDYLVNASTGRMVMSASELGQNIGDHPLVGYVIPVPSTLTREICVHLASCVTGFLLSTDATAQAGQLEFQTPTIAPPPPFSNLYLTGYFFYGTDEGVDALTPLFAGASNADPTGGKYAGIQSASYPDSSYCLQPGCALLLPNEALTSSGAYSVNSNGSASIGGETIAVTNGNVTFYIDESPLNSHPSVIVVEQ
ncbi:MAG: putative Ig domain-containing protein [Candidatus Sulfotelmatobacter sp.]